MKFFDYLKNIVLILIIIQLTPLVLSTLKNQYRAYLEPKTKVAIIDVKDTVYNSDSYNKQLQTYFKDTSIKAILLKIECFGGASGSCQAIFNEIQQLKKEHPKPIISLVENVCASGGYYIACATDHIIAPACALIGSIGTAFPYLFKVKEFLDQYKIHNEPLAAGTFKNATNPFVESTPQDRALLQSVLDDSYQQFTHDVAVSRKLSPTTLKIWADGKIFTARQALPLGLVDTLGSAHQALAIIKERALIEGEIEWIHKKEPSGLARLLSSDDDDNSNSIFAHLSQLCIEYLASARIHL